MARHSLGRIGGQDASWIGYFGVQIQITTGRRSAGDWEDNLETVIAARLSETRRQLGY
jgi:hypothetical protein